MTTAQDQQSRAEFEAAWMKKPGVTKPPARFPNGGDYAYPAANTAWWAWQAARALTAGMEPVAEIVECRVMGQQTVAEVAGSWNFLSVGTKLYTEAQVQAMGRVPETWAIYDSEGLYETRDTEDACKSFCDHYNARDEKLGGGLGTYTYRPLYAAAPRPSAAQEQNLSNSAEFARTPLTDEQINAALIAWFGRDTCLDAGYQYRMRAAINAAHNITHPTGD